MWHWQQKKALFLRDLKPAPRILWLLEVSGSKENRQMKGNLFFFHLMGDLLPLFSWRKDKYWNVCYIPLGSFNVFQTVIVNHIYTYLDNFWNTSCSLRRNVSFILAHQINIYDGFQSCHFFTMTSPVLHFFQRPTSAFLFSLDYHNSVSRL